MNESNTDRQKEMFSAVSTTIENFTFMEVFPASGPDPSLSRSHADLLSASQLVLEPIQGEFSLTMSRNLLTQLAMSVYGPLLSGSASDENLHDLLAELLNTIVGRFLGEILPQEKGFRLDVPQSSEEASFASAGPQMVIWQYSIDDEIFSINAAGVGLVRLCRS